MAEELTPQQRAAVENRGGRLLVSAAAGSGKTKVLVDRLLSYITDPMDARNIDDFLMITYTKAAASELRGKIAAKLSQRVAENEGNVHLQRQLQRLYLTKISTVHSFCGDILREYAYMLDLAPDFRVADEMECLEIRHQVMEKLLDDAYDHQMDDPAFLSFVDTQGLGRDDRLVPEIVMQVYDASRCHLDPEAWLQHCLELVQTQEYSDAGQTLYGKYLMDRFFHWLDNQIPVLQRCYDIASEAELQKPAANLESILAQIRKLRSSKTWQEIVENQSIDFGRFTFPRNYENAQLMESLKAVRESFKKELPVRLKPFDNHSDQVLSDLSSSAVAVQGLIELVRRFGKAFDAAKRDRRILDFGDLEHRMLDLLLGKSRSGSTQIAKEIGSRFREVMVDEYQDSNQVQDAIYAALTDEKRNLFMVGDVKQSIYQFRLADPGIFLEKYQRFAPAEIAKPGEDRKVVLSRNFRSSAGVLAGCNDVFRTCMCPEVGGIHYGEDEALYEGLDHVALPADETELVCIDVQEDTYQEEAEFVASHICDLLEHGAVRDGDHLRKVRPEDIAILLRSPGPAGIYFQRALDRRGIRYATGGGVDLLQTQEISTLYSILQVIHNPRLDIPLVAAMSSPIFGFSGDDLAAIRSKNKKCQFYDALCMDRSPKSQEFLATLKKLRLSMRHYGLTRLLEQVIVETGFEEIYGAMEEGELKKHNIRTFFQLVVDFEGLGNSDLGRFLEHISSMSEKCLISPGEQSAAGCVTIMSIHKSKGLEFPVVYLCGLGREFNKESQRANVLSHKDMGIGLSAVDGKNRLRYPTIAKRAIAAQMGMDAVSEELRVLYVAMTRARDRLIMTYASRYLQKDLTAIVQTMNMGGAQLLIEQATCPGDWVLLTALQKTDAGALFALSGYPDSTKTDEIPWNIRVVSPAQPTVDIVQTTVAQRLPPVNVQMIVDGLSFVYGHSAAVSTPSKQTATGLKGRHKDQEAAENAGNQRHPRQWRTPEFMASMLGGTDYGNAVHRVMQHLNFKVCTDVQSISKEIQRLSDHQYITLEQAKLVDAKSISAFFETEIGKKIQCGNVIREFKFSILEDATSYDPSLSGEQVLLQGVVDCALLEDDGITIVDFKTDYVTEDTLFDKVHHYLPQVDAYANALQRIYELPVKNRYLYFFHLNRFAQV